MFTKDNLNCNNLNDALTNMNCNNLKDKFQYINSPCNKLQKFIINEDELKINSTTKSVDKSIRKFATIFLDLIEVHFYNRLLKHINIKKVLRRLNNYFETRFGVALVKKNSIPVTMPN